MVWPFKRKPKTWPAITHDWQKPGDAELVAQAQNAVLWFVDYLGDDILVADIRDASELAIPKDALINAFTIAMAMEDRPEHLGMLLQTGLLLAHFQEGIGAKPLRQLPDESVEGIGEDHHVDLILAHKPEADRFTELYPKVSADLKTLGEKFQRSVDVSSKRTALK